MLGTDRAQHLRVGRVAGLALAAGRQLERLEQDASELLRRAEHELLARELVRERLELLHPVGEASRDLSHPVRVDANAGFLHPAEHADERHLDVAVERFGSAFAHAVEQRVAQAQRDGGVTDQAGSLLLGLRLGDGLDRVLGREVVEEVLAARRIDQVGEDHRVVGGLDSKRFRVVRNEGSLEPRGPRRDDDLVAAGDCDASLVCSNSARVRRLPFTPGDGRTGRDPLPRGHGLVELVDAREQRPELELPERLAQLCAIGRREHELGRVGVEIEVSAHRREHLRRARLLGELGQVLLARRRQLVDMLEHLFERAVLRDELAGGLVPDAWDARNVVRGVALEADEIGNLVGPDPVARLDPLGRVDVDVAHPARRHHQADVLRDELERVAVGRDHARLDPGFVGARRESRDHVVRLPALELEVAVAECLHDRPQVRELLAEQVRHRPAAFLVHDVRGLGLRRAVHRPCVPGDRDAFRPVVGEELEEHVREAEQRVGGEAFARREFLGQREERSIGEVVAVDEEELRVARGRVAEVELSSCERLRRHRSESIAPT